MPHDARVIKKDCQHDTLLRAWAHSCFWAWILVAHPHRRMLLAHWVERVHPTLITSDHILEQQGFITQSLEVLPAHFLSAGTLLIHEQFWTKLGSDVFELQVFSENFVG